MQHEKEKELWCWELTATKNKLLVATLFTIHQLFGSIIKHNYTTSPMMFIISKFCDYKISYYEMGK